MVKASLVVFILSNLLMGCAGMKVVDPNKPDTKGTLAVDWSGDSPKLVGTYTCTMVGSNGKRVYATAKSEADARQEVIARCQDQTVISFCKVARMSCEKN
ncbi:hypothetical protein ACLSU7_04810 [Bdellovibrio sp. HCB185ZH]|uniref:hypothetical protein n=1 Tax=Bdellovibrio sp. HCB185ZH TaxID=3394235 RepID=UPI0039A4F8BB